jgi:hypothetical protein
MGDRRLAGGCLALLLVAVALEGCASSPGEAPDPSAPTGATSDPQSLFDSVRPSRHDPRAADASDLRRDVPADAPELASLPGGRGTSGKLLIFRSITGHVPLKDRSHAVSQSPAEREAARAAEIEAELEEELGLGVYVGDIPPEEPSAPRGSGGEASDPAAAPLDAPLAPPEPDLPLSSFETSRVTIVAGSWGNSVDLEVVRGRRDVDGDGRVDEIHYIDESSGTLLRKEQDRDGNGSSDAWNRYEGGRLVERVLDSDADGSRDVWEHYADGRMRARYVDADYDGKRDTAYLYREGLLAEKHLDADEDGLLERLEHFEQRHRVRMIEDSNGDGQMDTWTTYRAVDGRDLVARIERDGLGHGRPTIFETYEVVGGKAVLVRREEDVDGDGKIDDALTYEDGEPVLREISGKVLSPL